MTPAFKPDYIAWMEMGGVLAVANLRGGGEYGEDWHLAGKTLKKQNVFDDFIAAAEWLIAEGRTSREKLAIMGGSNGGLLVGAVEVQRPDLFGACIPMVGVLDMLRFHQFTAGQFWRDEFGNSRQPGRVQDAARLLAVSQHQGRHEVPADADHDGRHRRPRGADAQLQIRGRDAAGPGRRRADPAADRIQSRPRPRHAGLEADRNRGRPLGVFGERIGDGCGAIKEP